MPTNTPTPTPTPASDTVRAGRDGGSESPFDLVLDPAPKAWGERAKAHFVGQDGRAREARRGVGLAGDRPVVMGGHQPTLWHAGIFAKWLAGDACARAIGGEHAWLVVAQDAVDPGFVRVPIRREGGPPGARDHHLQRAGTTASDAAACSRPAFDPRVLRLEEGESLATPALGGSTDRLTDALRAHADGPNAAHQVVRATADLLSPLSEPPQTVFAEELMERAPFDALLGAMRDDPRACARYYNEAVAAHPGSGLRPLSIGTERVELPLWKLEAGKPRRSVFSDALADLDPGTLAPRALLMTLGVRLMLCDLFVHGTGGRSYEPVNDGWASSWLRGGDLDRPLAPVAIASATVTLNIGEDHPPTEREVARAVWEARHARHHPRLLGDDGAQQERDALVAQIGTLPRKSKARAEVFAALQGVLERARAHAGEKIHDLDAQASDVAERARARGVVLDRTWAAVLHEPASLNALRAEIDSRFDRTNARGASS